MPSIFLSRFLHSLSLTVCLFISFFFMAIPDLWAADGASQACRFAKVATLPVVVRNNRILVDAAINGQPVQFEIDTGAQATMLFTSAAIGLDLPITQLPGRHAFGVDGEMDLRQTEIATFNLATWSTKGWWVRVMGDSAGWARERIAGLLGEDFFHHFDVEFDLPGGKVTLFQAENCDDATLSYWSADAQQVDMRGISSQHPAVSLPVTLNDRPVQALLDSGASISLVGLQAAVDAGVTPDSPGVAPAQGPVGGLAGRALTAWTGSFASIAIGGETIRNTRLTFADIQKHTKSSETGSHIGVQVIEYGLILGVDFLKAHRVLIAHSQNRLYFTYAGGPVFFAK